jgi:hypothetical protein
MAITVTKNRIDVSYQVSVHLAKRRRLKCEKLTYDRRWTPSDGKKLTLPSARYELKKSITFFKLTFIEKVLW